jgi:HSP20 family molecular chaperone IbpA
MKPPVKRRGKTPGAPGKETEFPFRLSVDGDRAFVVADLSGTSEEKISLDLGKGTLIISAVNGATRLKRRFAKGILELTLERSDR